MNVELTRNQINLLQVYILMTKNHRAKEREAWESLKDEISVAKSNAQWYADLESRLQEIYDILDNVR